MGVVVFFKGYGLEEVLQACSNRNHYHQALRRQAISKNMVIQVGALQGVCHWSPLLALYNAAKGGRRVLDSIWSLELREVISR